MSARRPPPRRPDGNGTAGLFARDTIAAIATAPGRGAIAIVRISGPDAERICRRVVSPWPSRARHASRCRVHAGDNASEAIDDGLVTVFPAPHSYTGETIVEIGVHGGMFVPDAVYAAVIAAGARAADPGEFTRRAVLNGKLDLVRAEAVADLIDARSRAAHRMALQQLSGALSDRYGTLRSALLELEALIAYDIDFPEEDDGRLPRGRIAASCRSLEAELDALLATVPSAILGRDGATVVLAGPPNSGKSSLLNALVGEARVIVSDTPGTTRDAVEVLLEHEPWPLRLVDTAGLRDAGADALERQGIDIASRYLADAHAVIACGETRVILQQAADAIAARTPAPLVGAHTKADLRPDGDDGPASHPFPVVPVSAVRGSGLTELLDRVTAAVASRMSAARSDTPMVTRARHRAALQVARDEVAAFRLAWEQRELPAPVAATHLRSAEHALDDLIGAVDVEDVFARVFATFCVGK